MRHYRTRSPLVVSLTVICGLLLVLSACGTDGAAADDANGQDAGSTGIDAEGSTDGGDGDVPSTDGAAADTAVTIVADQELVTGFLNIAHRGGKMLRPAHTLAAYKHALEVGANLIEFDLHASKDGVLVAIHDDTVDKTTDGTGKVKEKTWAELEKLDAGYNFTKDGGKTFPYRGKGHKIARLDEALKAFPKALYSVEFKQADPSIVDATLALFADNNALGRTIFASFSDATIAKVRKKYPKALTAFALAEMLTFQSLDKKDYDTYKPPALFVQPPEDLLTQEIMDKATHFGLRVTPWTVNKSKRMKELIDMGVHGMFTDDPETLAGLAPKK
ncbi:MAG: glycerophosphodiester phosphodiesterase [Myxococcales bacterium]|nr:glycerophosphodiester phosphodiesterase [Myxococcales bacterium]